MSQVVAILTRHKRESGAQFLAGVDDAIELPQGSRLELCKSDLSARHTN